MKFIAATDFYNAPSLGIKTTDDDGELLPGFKHKDMIHKGAAFSIGSANSLKGEPNQVNRENISTVLLYGFAVADDGTKESKDAIARVKSELAAETAKEKALAAKAAAQLSVPEQIAQGVAQALAALGVKPTPAK